jgi:hypothetical protein
MNHSEYHCHSEDSSHLLSCSDRSCQHLSHSTHVVRWSDRQTGRVVNRYDRFESDGHASEAAQKLGGTADSLWHYVLVVGRLVLVQGAANPQ